MMKTLLRAAFLALGLMGVGSVPATAASVTSTSATVTTADTGFKWTVDFICSAALPCYGGNPGTTLAGKAVFTLTSVTTSSGNRNWAISLSLSNTGLAGAITAMGFGTNPNATMGSVSDSSGDGIVFGGGSGSIPGFSGTELCVWDYYNCSSTWQQGLTKGKTDTMSFVLRTSSTITALTFSDFAARVAGVGAYCRDYSMGGTIRVAPVPLPASGGLLLLGLGALALLRRRRAA